MSGELNTEQRLEELLENLVNQAPGALYQFRYYPKNEEMVFLYASQGIYDIFELYPAEILADCSRLFQRIHPDFVDQIMNSIEKSAAEMTVWKEIFKVVLPQKGERWVQGNAQPEKISDGSIIWHGNIRDITEEKEREKEIELFAKSLKSISDAVLITNQNFEIEYINAEAEKLFGYKLAEIKGKTPGIFNAEEISEKIQDEIYQKISRGEVYKNELLNRRKDGSTFICEMKINPLLDKNGEINAYIGIQRDITKKKKQQQQLEYQLRFQRALTSISSDLLDLNSANLDRKINTVLEKIGYFFDIDRSYIFQFSDDNQKTSNTYEWSAEGIESQKEKLQQLSTDSFPWWMSQLKRNQFISITDVKQMPQEAEAEQKMLKMQNVKSIIVMPMFIENELFGFFGFDFVREKKIFTKRDIRLLKIFTDFITNAFSKHLDYQKIRKLTYHDSLTGLYNRRFFEEELNRLDTERQLPIAIIVSDINGLKIINDSFGHQKGDCLIKKSAEILKNEIRNEDILARHGGDEFAILLPQTSAAAAEKIVSRIKKHTAAVKSDELTISISFGIAVKNTVEEKIYDTFKRADNKMYHNKLSQSKSIKNKIVQGLISTLEVKSNETKEHTVRMTRFSINFGKYLGLSNFELNRLSLLSTLHDIGKITIENSILKKPNKLSNREWEIIKQHPEAGYNIAKSSEEFAVVAEEIYSHHERWDGSGYPRGLKGTEIPFLARIISIVDAYDVMTSERPYKKRLTKKEAIEEIKGCAKKQFDPELAAKFIDFLNEKNM